MGSQRASQRKVTASPPEEEVDELESRSEEEQEWEARAILDEKEVPNPDYKKLGPSGHSSRSKCAVPQTVTQYLIDWEGFDPDTGERWEPTWENGEGATQGLVDEWNRRKETDPELVGRYTRNVEEKKRRLAAKEKSQRRGSTRQSATPKKPTAGQGASGSGAKAGTSAAAAAATEPEPRRAPEAEPESDSPSTSKSITSERRQRRNIVTSPVQPEEHVQVGESSRARQRESASRQQQDEASAEKAKDASKRKREKRAAKASREAEIERAPDVSEKKKQALIASPASVQSATGGKRKRQDGSRKRLVRSDSEEENGSATIVATTTTSENTTTVRDGDGRKAKKRKLLGKPSDATSKKDSASANMDGANVDKTPKSTTAIDTPSSSKSKEGRKKSRKANADAPAAAAETPPSRGKTKQASDKPGRSHLSKQSTEASPAVDRSHLTNSPSIVGDSQPPLTSSGESRESQKTPSQRTPSDLSQSTEMRRLAISGAMNQASLGSPKRPKQNSPPSLVNAEAGPSRLAAAPAPSRAPAPVPAQDRMDVDEEFVPNSLFAMDDDGSQDGSPDVPQSQALALQRAIDLLMMEENFLEHEQAAYEAAPVAEPIIQDNAVAPEVEPTVHQEPTTASNADDAAVPKEIAGKGKEPSKRARKPFAAVDDFVAPPQPEAPVPTVPVQTATTKPPSTSKPLHPLPQIAPSVFRNAGITGTPDASANTQPDSIHDFDSPHRATGGVEAEAAPPVIATVMQVSEQTVAANRAIETEVIIEQIIAQMPGASAESSGRAEEEEESQLAELGEDVWSRILDTATIDPSMLGRPPGAVEDEEMTSSEENSHRSDENMPPPADLEEPPTDQSPAAALPDTTTQHADLLVANAKLRVLESDLARSRLESKQLEDQVKALKADLQEASANTHNQVDIFKDLYNKASEMAMRLRRENEELTDDNDKLKAQVELGLKQKQLFLDSLLEAKVREIDQLTAQNEILIQQAERTDKLRECASRLPQVEAQLRHMEADRAACGECQRRLDSQVSNDSDTEYQPYKAVVFDNDTETRRTRNRAQAKPEDLSKPVERFVPSKPVLHAPEQALQNAEARKKLAVTDPARWTRDNIIITQAETPLESQPGVDVAEVEMVHICRWRPEHGNACCALLANREDLASHALSHLAIGQGLGK